MKQLSILISGLYAVMSCSAIHESFEFPDAKVNTIHIQADSGSIKITRSDSPGFRVETQKVNFSEGDQFDVSVTDGKLSIVSRAASRSGRQSNCKVDYQISLHRSEVPISIDTGESTIDFSRLNNPITINGGEVSGTIRDSSGPISIEVGKANITIQDVKGVIKAGIGSGTINADYSYLPADQTTLDLSGGTLTSLIKLPTDATVYAKYDGMPLMSSFRNAFSETAREVAKFICLGSFATGSMKIEKKS